MRLLVRLGRDHHVLVQAARSAPLLLGVLRHNRPDAGTDATVPATSSPAALPATAAFAAAAAATQSPITTAIAICPTTRVRGLSRCER